MKFRNTRHAKSVPTISSSPAYTAGDSVGGVQTIGPLGSINGSGFLRSLLLVDAANQKPALTILIFRDVPTGTYTDNAAIAPSAADIANCIGKLNVLTTDWETINGKAYASFQLNQILVGSPVTSDDGAITNKFYVYLAALTTGTPTFTSAADLTLHLGMDLD